MADNAQLEIRIKLEQEVKQRNREQYESMFAGIARIQRDSNLADFYDEADEIMHALDVPSSAMDLPPDPRIVARYTSMVRRVQGKIATSPQLPGAPGSQQQSNISPLNPSQHAALSSQLAQAGINVNPLANFNAPMAGGQVPLGGRRGRGVGQSGLPADIQRFAQQYQAELAQIGDEVFDRLEKQVLSDQMRERAVERARQIRDEASRQALRFPLASPSRSAVRDIERGAAEMYRRLSGQSSQLGFAGAEQVRYDQDVAGPLQDLVRQGIGGGRINQDSLRDAVRAAEMRRGEIRVNPDIDPSVARRRTEALAQAMRQASQIARLSPEIVQRGTPGMDLASVSPGAVAGFENLQRIRADLQGAREGPMGQLASNRQRELLAELNINQQINRVEQERLRSEGLMTRERQHRFNVLQNEYRLTERDIQGAPVRLTAGDISRQAAMMGPQALIGQALQRIAFERGDVGGTGGLAAAGQLLQRGGFGGLMMGGLMFGGSRLATAGAGLLGGGGAASGGTGALIGGLGAMAPVLGIGAVAAGAAMVLSQVNSATQIGMGASNLWRRGGGRDLQGLGNNFMDQTGFMNQLLNSGNGLAFSREEALSTAQILSQTGGLRGGGAGLIADRTRDTLRAARFMGIDPNAMAQGMGTMESMNLVGTGPNRFSQERFADLLASAVNRGGMRGRETDVLTAVTSLTQALAVRGMTTPEMTQQTVGLITALNASGSPGLRGQFGAQLLGQMDTSVTGARGLQEALLYQAYNRQAGGGMNYLQFIEEQGKGMGSQYFLGGVADIANLGGQDPTRRALALITQYFGGDRSKIGQARQLDELIRSNQLTPEAFQRLTSGTMETEGYQPGAGLQGVENLTEAQNALTRNFQDLASAMLPVIEGMTKLGTFFSGFATGVVGKITNPRPEKQLEAVPAAIPLPGGGAIPLPPIQPDIETPFGPIPNPLHPGREAPELPQLPIEPNPTIIQTPFGPITIPDIRIGDPRLPAAPAPNLPMPGPPSLPQNPMVPGPSEIPPVGLNSIRGINQYTAAEYAGNERIGGFSGKGLYDRTCGPAAITEVLRAQGQDVTIGQVTAFASSIGAWGSDGIYLSRVPDILSHFGGSAVMVSGIANINQALEAGHPVLSSITGGMDPQGRQHSFPEGHIVTLTGRTAEGNYTIADSSGWGIEEISPRRFRNIGENAVITSFGAPGLPSGGRTSPSAIMAGSPEANRNAVIRTARALGQNPALALSVIPAEGGFTDIMLFQGRNPGDHRPGRGGGRGMFQFDTGGELPGYLAFLKEKGVVPANTTVDDLYNIPAAWAPELQTEYFYRYAKRQGALVGPDATAEQIAAAAHRAQRNESTPANMVPGVGPGTGDYLNAARDVLKAPIELPEDEVPESYAPMDRSGQAAMGAINVALRPAVLTLMWPNGEVAGQVQINGDVDVPSTIDRTAYRSMGYYG